MALVGVELETLVSVAINYLFVARKFDFKQRN